MSVIQRGVGDTFQGQPFSPTEIVNQYFRSQQCGRNYGDMMFGPDASQWPCWVEDVLTLFEQEKRAAEQAQSLDLSRKGATSNG